jgi:3-oxoadipate enol-lactonase/4-carboxymuconolactone decarboxylase
MDFDKGLQLRKKVLGDAHVERSLASAKGDPFTEDLQQYVTAFAWGDIWARPGLDRRSRSVATLAALVALGAENEVPLHVRAALRNGLSPDEIKEVILHTAVYAGVPRANSAFAIAQQVIAEERDA